jgi:hypothetical protein
MSNKVLRDYCTSIKESLKQICDENDELMAQIEKLQIEKERLQSELNIANALTENTKNKKWQPKAGETFYYLNPWGGIVKGVNVECTKDWFNSPLVYFKSEQEADQYLENLNTKDKLKQLADELNGGKVIDWLDEAQNKYVIVLEVYTNKLKRWTIGGIQQSGQIYCLDKDFKQKAIKRIGEQRLIDMIRSGV